MEDLPVDGFATHRDDEPIGNAPTTRGLIDAEVGLANQQRAEFDRMNSPTEEPRRQSIDEAFESTLDSASESHWARVTLGPEWLNSLVVRLPALEGEWRNWQTRRIQVPVGSRSWGFNSPLAHTVSYSPAARRKRRRRMIAILGVVGVLLGVTYGVTQAQGERETTRAYLDVAFEVAAIADEVSASLSDLVVNIEEYNRATLIERLGSMEASVEVIIARLLEVEAPSSLGEAGVFLRIAAGAWRSGISDSRVGLPGAIGESTRRGRPCRAGTRIDRPPRRRSRVCWVPLGDRRRGHDASGWTPAFDRVRTPGRRCAL